MQPVMSVMFIFAALNQATHVRDARLWLGRG